MCVSVSVRLCARKGETGRETEPEAEGGGSGWEEAGPGLCERARGKRGPGLTTSSPSSLFMLPFQATPELFINTDVLAEKDLPLFKSGQGGRRHSIGSGTTLGPQEVSANEVFLSPSSCFFQSGENKSAH